MEYSTQPPEQSLPLNVDVPLSPPKSNRSLVIGFLIIAIFLVAGSVFAGIQIGKNQTPIQQLVVVQPTTSPNPQTAVNPTLQPTTNPTTDPTTDWKTYTNNEYNFTIKYPPDAKVSINQPESNDEMLLVVFDSPNAIFDHLFKSGGYSFQISMQTKKNFNTLDEYLSFQMEHNMYEEVLPKTYNNVNGYLFKNDKGYPGLNFIFRGFVAKNDDLYYTINYYTDDSVDMFDQILSTFKFTN